jgi:Ca2+/H+ antiporter
VFLSAGGAIVPLADWIRRTAEQLARTSGPLDGETNWFEGVLLLSVYAVLGLAFFFVR